MKTSHKSDELNKKKKERGIHKSGTYEGIYMFKVDKETISSRLSCV
jgi:hypothetical protein